MKTCPFCAEEIQPEAIKCRFCNSFLNAGTAAAGTTAGQGDAIAQAAAPADPLRPVGRANPTERKLLYSGSPSWRAFFWQHFFVTLLAAAAIAVGVWFGKRNHASQMTMVLVVGIPLALAIVGYLFLLLFRRSMIVRVTTSNIETEKGVLSKRIDVLELWRCRDVRYFQSMLDRILGIAHIEVTTTDVTTPQLTIFGLPASRQLFEKIRDSIELQRQHHNVVGMVQ